MPEVSVPLSAPGVSTEGLYLWHSPVTRPVYLQGGQTGLDKGLPAIIQSERTPGSELRPPVGASVSWPWFYRPRRAELVNQRWPPPLSHESDHLGPSTQLDKELGDHRCGLQCRRVCPEGNISMKWEGMGRPPARGRPSAG